jgi:hypothetical protein
MVHRFTGQAVRASKMIDIRTMDSVETLIQSSDPETALAINQRV